MRSYNLLHSCFALPQRLDLDDLMIKSMWGVWEEHFKEIGKQMPRATLAPQEVPGPQQSIRIWVAQVVNLQLTLSFYLMDSWTASQQMLIEYLLCPGTACSKC